CSLPQRACAHHSAPSFPTRRSSDLAYTDYDRMLAEAALDAVLICTPHALHGPQAAAALERGLHVLVEKPLALTAREAEGLAARADRKSTRLNSVTFRSRMPSSA